MISSGMSTDDAADDAAEKRRHERKPVTLCVDYDGAEDLLADYTDNLSAGGTFVVTQREMAIGTEIRLVLSFPGLLQPIHVDGVVRWLRGADEPDENGETGNAGVGIEFAPGPGRAHLEQVTDRLRRGDSGLIRRVVRVLLVEDNPHVAELIREGLRGSSKRDLGSDLSFDFREAHNGREALELLREVTFDALIVDIYLPVIDGAQVIHQVRQELKLPELPIIAVSAGGEPARSAALAAGANIFLDKPMRLRQVIDTMRRLMKL
jgi:uncharacterized protein (TIGR02266 family)